MFSEYVSFEGWEEDVYKRQEYGVQIKKSSLGGVCVTLEIKYEEENQDEDSDAGGR